MMLSRAIVLGVLVITGTAWAVPQVADQRLAEPADLLAAPEAAGLAPRAPLPKRPVSQLKMQSWSSGRLVIKFADNVKARVSEQSLQSLTATNVATAQRIIRTYGLTVKPAINLQPSELIGIQNRAAAHSGKAQPDLAGLMYLIGPQGASSALLEAAARELNGLPEVEFVEFETEQKVGGGPGACCVSATECQQTDFLGCTALGGDYQGDGTSCATPNICAGSGTTGRCCIPSDGNVTCVDDMSEGQCLSQSGIYGGNGTTCAAIGDTCPLYGACCTQEECQTLVEAACVTGTFIGPGTNCGVPGVCQPAGEVGRCCIPAGTDPPTVNCLDAVDQDFCDEQGGVYGGNGTDCADLGGVCPIIGACCVDNECLPLDEKQCGQIPESLYLGDGSNCTDDGACEDPDCGVPGTGSCFECHDPFDPFSAGLFCDDEDCCAIVCAIDPFCCEEDADVTPPGRQGPPHWDANCVAIANTRCPGQPPLNACTSPFSGPCNEPHETPGCIGSCCVTVCGLEPFCCTNEWDALCVQIGAESCPSANPAATTPQFSDAQGYLTGLSYVGQFDTVPVNAASGIILDECGNPVPTLGWDGSGWALEQFWQFGQFIASQHGPGAVNRTRGKGIKVAVIEHSAFADWQNPANTHEDLRGKVIPEPGQTIIINPLNPYGELGGQHGTACLGIIGAKDDGMKGHSLPAVGYRDSQGNLHVSDEIGIVGIAPEADLCFFPIISLEEGGRLLTAIAKAQTVFGPGDVMSFSIGPGGGCNQINNTLASEQANWLMLAVSTDLGIVSCISAGNDCCNIDTGGQFDGLDSGVIIVGAVTPGYPYCRLGFSNNCQACADANQVHVSAWGQGVTTLGYGSLFFGNDPANSSGHWVRTYTNSFGGTSAACPQIAALAACVQGLAKQHFGIPLTPGQVRFILSNNGFPQCNIGSVPDIPGPPGDSPCGPDSDPESDPSRISGENNRGAYPVPITVGESVVSVPMGDNSGQVDSICILRGQYQYGNAASIRSVDANYLRVVSQYTTRRDRPSSSTCSQFAVPISTGVYLGNGEVVDVLIEATNATAGANVLRVDTKIGYPGALTLQFAEAFDWNTNRWVLLGMTQMNGPEIVCVPAAGQPDVCRSFTVNNAGRFIQQGTGRILARVYVLTPAINTDLALGNSDGHYTARFDTLNVTTSFQSQGGFNPGNAGGGTGLN